MSSEIESNHHLFLSMDQAKHIYNELDKYLDVLKGYSAICAPVGRLVISYPCETKTEGK